MSPLGVIKYPTASALLQRHIVCFCCRANPSTRSIYAAPWKKTQSNDIGDIHTFYCFFSYCSSNYPDKRHQFHYIRQRNESIYSGLLSNTDKLNSLSTFFMSFEGHGQSTNPLALNKQTVIYLCRRWLLFRVLNLC